MERKFVNCWAMSLTECSRSDSRSQEMPNFFLPVSDLEHSMKAIYGIGRQLPVTAQVQLFSISRANDSFFTMVVFLKIFW